MVFQKTHTMQSLRLTICSKTSYKECHPQENTLRKNTSALAIGTQMW